MQRPVQLPHWPPLRIVSVVPSQTELLADLGLEAEVVGITKFCVHPRAWFQHKKRVGGTKTLNIAAIIALQPDLIIGNKEENEQEQIAALAGLFPVWMSDILNLDDALEMIREIGRLTNRADKALTLASEISTGFQQLLTREATTPSTAAYLIWRKPYMAAGSGTFVHDMLGYAGFYNVFGDQRRYPEVTLADLTTAQPAVILLSSEPYPFAQKHIAELQRACPTSSILLVDGEAFSWYGSRLRSAPGYFLQLQEMLKSA